MILAFPFILLDLTPSFKAYIMSGMKTVVPTNGPLTIGQAAEAAGVAATTLRYYEREGLLRPSSRSHARYRLYDADAVERLRFIRAAQAVGFTLDDIRLLLDLDSNDPKVCRSEVQRLLERRLAEVKQKTKDLKRVQAVLGRSLDRCRGSQGACPVLKDLSPAKRTAGAAVPHEKRRT
jgi:DNA-binding transcriptional MerR regulator